MSIYKYTELTHFLVLLCSIAPFVHTCRCKNLLPVLSLSLSPLAEPFFFPSLVVSSLNLSLATCVELTLAGLPIHRHLQGFRKLLTMVDAPWSAVMCLALGWLLLQHVVDPPTSALILDVGGYHLNGYSEDFQVTLGVCV